MKKLMLLLLVIVLIFPLTGHAQRPDAPQYAQRGPYAVGTREVSIAAGQGIGQDQPLTATLWYPALNPDGVEEAVDYRVMALTVPGRAILDAAPDADNGPYPLVVFSHGNGGLRYNSLWFTEHLASHGFVVIAADHPGNTIWEALQGEAVIERNMLASLATRPFDVLREIAFMESLAADDPLAGLVDLDRIAITGHSFGGFTALSVGGARLDFAGLAEWCADPTDFPPPPDGIPARDLSPDALAVLQAQTCMHAQPDGTPLNGPIDLTRIDDMANRVAAFRGLDAAPDGLWPATTDPRVRAVVAMAPGLSRVFGAEGLEALDVSTLVLVGSADIATVPESEAYSIYHYISSTDKALAVFENAGHTVFIDACSDVMMNMGLFWACSDAVWDMARVHDLSNHMATAFLLSVLYDDTDAAAALAPELVDFMGVYYARD